jgi:ATP-dependent Clp protease ATP-binding subunit ClpC
VVVLAQEEARYFGHRQIGTEHLLLGLVHEGDGYAARALRQLGVDETGVRAEVERRLGRSDDAPPSQIPFTARSKKALEMALREALQLGHNYIGTEHILLGVIAEPEDMAVQVLGGLGVDPATVRTATLDLLGGATAEPAARPTGATSALCPTCRLPLADRLGVQAVAVTLGDLGAVDQQVLVAYCRSCGCSVGLVAASPPSPASAAPPASPPAEAPPAT